MKAAVHIAWVAATLAAMPDEMAVSMSTTDRILPADLTTIRRLLPSVAAKYGLHAGLKSESGSVTVWFDRRGARGAD
jgi:hypothetical protein